MYFFTVAVLNANGPLNVFFKYIISIPYCAAVVLAITSPFTRLLFYVDENGYHAGKFYNAVYVVGFFYALLSFMYLLVYWKRINKRRGLYSMLLYNMIIITALIVRLAFPTYLLYDTFILMGIIFVFFAFLNPEYYLELRSQVFNSRALRQYMDENIGKLDCICLGIVVHRYHVVRDIYGANQTDAGLNMIGKYLKQLFPKDIIFYYRKGRYIVLLPSETDVEEYYNIIMERFLKPWKSDEAELYLTAGAVTMDLKNNKNSADVILSTLVQAMAVSGEDENKQLITVTDGDMNKVINDTEIRRSLEAAIDADEVLLYLQPLVDVNGKVVGAEALARIKDSAGNIIPPGVFIPLAEKSGRINEMGEQIFEKTCKFIELVDMKKSGIEWVNVNLSPIQFIRTDLANRYADIAKKYGIDPKRVHLEITEESMIDDSFLQRQIQAMEEKGFKFVLDDYGTGYSNLARLKKCPFINVKLDKSLVWDYDKDPGEIIPSMVYTFKNIGFSITAEGVETEQMVEKMRSIGCDYLQGYYFSKPIPAEEFVKKYMSGER
ncbi:MAG: EAL domain-containing protein [Lachnospiraceae bacterium]|nr:EAL domain-containing protein [Lachnospiraceae bacterium]